MLHTNFLYISKFQIQYFIVLFIVKYISKGLYTGQGQNKLVIKTKNVPSMSAKYAPFSSVQYSPAMIAKYALAMSAKYVPAMSDKYAPAITAQYAPATYECKVWSLPDWGLPAKWGSKGGLIS